MKAAGKIELAIHLVTTAFHGKVRIGPGRIPMSTHSLAVGLSLITYDYPIETIIAGILHDTKEDTEVTLAMIQRLFNERVAFLVQATSYKPELGEKIGEEELNLRVIQYSQIGEIDPLRIKCADSGHNLKTNRHLRPEAQRSAFESGRMRLIAAQKFMRNELLTEDFAIIVDRERTRLSL